MKKQVLLVLLISSMSTHVFNTYTVDQPREKPLQPYVEKMQDLFKIIISGYTLLETYFDTRQVVSFSLGSFALFPEKKVPDICDRDINSNGQFNMIAFSSRLRINVTGPNFLGTHATHAVVEGDFGSINLFRLRHAFCHLMWNTFSIFVGQYYSPIFVSECYPDVIFRNGDNPMAVFSRVPQIQFNYHFDHVDLIAAALGQFPFISDGPQGFRSLYARNSLMPNLHFQIKANFGDHYVGAGVDFKRLVPRLVSNKNVRVKNESIFSTAGTAYLALNWKRFSWHTKVNAGENMTNFGMNGGYAVKCVNDVTDQRDYTNLRVLGIWSEFIGRTKHLEPALFIGYTKNFGAGSKIIQSVIDQDGNEESTIYGIGLEIDNVFRISPRLRWFVKNVTVGLEIEYTRAAYGTITNTGKVDVIKPVANIRSQLSLYYYF